MSLERAKILDAALRLLDRSGLDGLTMRRLADTLGVKAPSLYWHYPGKPALLADMVATMLTPVAAKVAPDLSHRGVLRLVATELRGALLAHRDGALLLSGHLHSTLDGLRLGQIVIDALLRNGFATSVAASASFTLFNYVQGFVLDEQALGRDATGGMTSLLRPLTVAAATQYPEATAALADFLDADHDARFISGVDLVLAGLDQTAREDRPVERLMAALRSLG